ncbi:adenylyl-sulfate kinase [Candidatus Harpocratesius sp.]
MKPPILNQLSSIIEDLKPIARQAGQKILEFYNDDMQISIKSDKSPLTQADTAANSIIVTFLQSRFPEHAILSEESKDDKSRLENDFCWIVDPLDGTKEFIKRNDEFTVNIALAYKHRVILGIIYAPVLEELYYAAEGIGTFLEIADKPPIRLHVNSKTTDLTVVSSRSHKSEKLVSLLSQHQNKIKSEVSKGSSLKGCLVARGDAEIYYRFGYTMEWDTAAMQSIVEQAGGIFRQMDDSEMLYNRVNSLNEKGFYILNSIQNALHQEQIENPQEGAKNSQNQVKNSQNQMKNSQNQVKNSKNIKWHEGKVNRSDRLSLLGQKNFVLWFTGLSGSGKSTIAVTLERELFKQRKLVYRLDGDNIRHGLNADLGFSPEERNENLRRIIEVSKLFYDAGIIVLVSFISPYRKIREAARSAIGNTDFYEIYVKASVETCQQRDPKGLYKKAIAGEISDFTGVSESAPYEEPLNPEITINTEEVKVDQAVSMILKRLKADGKLFRTKLI